MSEPIRVEGADEVAASLKRLGKDISNDAEPAHKVAQIGAESARSRAPFVTGRLASGYMAEDRFITSDVPYVQFVEYGTMNMDAQFIVQQSLDSITGQAEEIYVQWADQKIAGVGFEPTG